MSVLAGFLYIGHSYSLLSFPRGQIYHKKDTRTVYCPFLEDKYIINRTHIQSTVLS